jgi:hypothetical protein
MQPITAQHLLPDKVIHEITNSYLTYESALMTRTRFPQIPIMIQIPSKVALMPLLIPLIDTQSPCNGRLNIPRGYS